MTTFQQIADDIIYHAGQLALATNDTSVERLHELGILLEKSISVTNLEYWEKTTPTLEPSPRRWRMHRLIKDTIELERAVMLRKRDAIARNFVQVQREIAELMIQPSSQKQDPLNGHELTTIHDYSDEEWLSVCIHCHHLFHVDGPNEWTNMYDQQGSELTALDTIPPCDAQ